MASFTIKKFPDDLLRKLKTEAATARRSLTQEVLARLESSLGSGDSAILTVSRGQEQANAWMNLPGTWGTEFSVEEEVEHLYRSRTEGREVTL